MWHPPLPWVRLSRECFMEALGHEADAWRLSQPGPGVSGIGCLPAALTLNLALLRSHLAATAVSHASLPTALCTSPLCLPVIASSTSVRHSLIACRSAARREVAPADRTPRDQIVCLSQVPPMNTTQYSPPAAAPPGSGLVFCSWRFIVGMPSSLSTVLPM